MARMANSYFSIQLTHFVCALTPRRRAAWWTVSAKDFANGFYPNMGMKAIY